MKTGATQAVGTVEDHAVKCQGQMAMDSGQLIHVVTVADMCVRHHEL